KTAAAELLIISPNSKAIKYSTAKTTCGPKWLTSEIVWLTINSAAPLLVMAMPSGSKPAIKNKIRQSTASYMSSVSMQPASTKAMAPAKALVVIGSQFKAATTITAAITTNEKGVRQP